jgi:hypothetical protein
MGVHTAIRKRARKAAKTLSAIGTHKTAKQAKQPEPVAEPVAVLAVPTPAPQESVPAAQ